MYKFNTLRINATKTTLRKMGKTQYQYNTHYPVYLLFVNCFSNVTIFSITAIIPNVLTRAMPGQQTLRLFFYGVSV
jgi:hypothetical protein